MNHVATAVEKPKINTPKENGPISKRPIRSRAHSTRNNTHAKPAIPVNAAHNRQNTSPPFPGAPFPSAAPSLTLRPAGAVELALAPRKRR